MINEISTRKELEEVKIHSSEGFKDIKPESSISIQEARSFINDIYKKSDCYDNKNNKNEVRSIPKDLEEKKGGSYSEVKKTSDGEKHEVHHMPADSASHLERDDGPAIRMEKEDHRLTASCGNSREAREYREKQKELIEHGKFRDALQMDIDDLHEKFGDKYDDSISEISDYVDQLEKEGKI